MTCNPIGGGFICTNSDKPMTAQGLRELASILERHGVNQDDIAAIKKQADAIEKGGEMQAQTPKDKVLSEIDNAWHDAADSYCSYKTTVELVYVEKHPDYTPNMVQPEFEEALQKMQILHEKINWLKELK